MMKKITTLLTAGCIITLATPVFAEEGGRRHHRNPEKLAEKFEDADTNKDGKLSLEEFRAKHEAKLEQRFKRLDADNDGFVTKEEMKAAKERYKGRRDKDEDEQE